MAEKSISPKGLKIKAGRMLSQYLKEMADEVTEFIPGDKDREDRWVTKGEALSRSIWKFALGWKEMVLNKKKNVVEEVIHKPDKSMIHMIFDRMEGKVPVTGGSARKKIPVDQRMVEQHKKRLNALTEFSSAGDVDHKTDPIGTIPKP